MYVYGLMTGLFAWISRTALSWTYFLYKITGNQSYVTVGEQTRQHNIFAVGYLDTSINFKIIYLTCFWEQII